MKVLLLGATGLLGHNVLRKLVESRHEVTALVRRADGIVLPYGRWRTVEGSILDYPTLLAASEGCEALVNCAGATDMSLLRRADYEPANVELCLHIARLAAERRLASVVHVSTVNTIGSGSSAQPSNEEAPMSPPFLGTFYADTKREGERAILDMAWNLPWCHTVVLNPGFMIGAYDTHPSSGKLLLAGWKKPLMAAPRGGKAFVYVGDVADAAVAALTKGRSGSRYLVTNRSGELSLRDFYRLQASTMGYRQRCLTLPDGLLNAAGRLGDLARRAGLRTSLSTANVQQLEASEHYDNLAARRDLGLRETPIEEAIRQFFQWYNNEKQS